MFKIKKHQDQVELHNEDNTSHAVIALNNEGGRLKSLSFDQHEIIADLEHKPYQKSHAGAILFPFVNRINEGKYEFHGKTYELKCNEPENNNAIHGLVFDKTFQVENVEEKSDFAQVKLTYTERNPPDGFPFKYKIELIYKLTASSLILKVNVQNIDNEAFLFNLGWHPYFCVEDFNTCFMGFNSHKQVIFSDRLIALGTAETLIPNPYSLKDKKLDDCFVLLDKAVELFTKDYKITISGKPKSNFLQIYAPPGEKRIAIEPMTGISDSFNHKKGIYILKPNQKKSETWTLNFSQ